MVIDAGVKIFTVVGIPRRVYLAGPFKEEVGHFNVFDLVHKESRFTDVNLGGGMVVTGDDVMIVL